MGRKDTAGHPDVLSVKDFGALGDGHHDDLEAISKALNVGGWYGIPINFPPGVYRINGSVTIQQKSIKISKAPPQPLRNLLKQPSTPKNKKPKNS